MKTLSKFGVLIASFVLAMTAGLGMAHAQQVTVYYKTFPGSTVLDQNTITTGCESNTANTYPNYQFLFWDNQGTISWNQTVWVPVRRPLRPGMCTPTALESADAHRLVVSPQLLRSQSITTEFLARGRRSHW